jgi:hypothetical protein
MVFRAISWPSGILILPDGFLYGHLRVLDFILPKIYYGFEHRKGN